MWTLLIILTTAIDTKQVPSQITHISGFTTDNRCEEARATVKEIPGVFARCLKQ